MCPSLRAYAKMPEIYETGGVWKKNNNERHLAAYFLK
jgi:hypothetical protein